MIKIRIIPILACFLAGLFNSCVMHDELEDCPQTKELKVKATLEFGNDSTPIAWPKGSAIGITVFRAGTNNCFGNNSDKKYMISDPNNGDSNPDDSNDPIYLPDDGSNADIIAYYPYSTPFDQTFNALLSVIDQSIPDSLDLITSDRECDIRPDTEQIHLKFYRRLSKLLFNITLIEVDENGKETVVNEKLAGTKLHISGIPGTGNYFLPDNQLTPNETFQTIESLINQAGTCANAIIFPRAAGEGVEFLVTLPDGTKKTFKMDPKLALQAGMEHVFDMVIKVKKTNPKPDPDPTPDPDEKTYKVTYELQGISSSQLTVTKNGSSDKWLLNTIVKAEKGSDFTFRISDINTEIYDLSSLRVTVNNANIKLLNGSYTIRGITEDKHIIIKINKQEPVVPPTPTPIYKVTYELIGTFAKDDILVTNTNDKEDLNAWLSTEVIDAYGGTNNGFKIKLKDGVIAEWSSNVTIGNQSNLEHTFSNIRQDIHIKIHRVFKVTLEYSDGLTVNKDLTTTVEDGGDYFNLKPVFDDKIYDATSLTVTVDGTKIYPEADGTYKIAKITANKHIVISIKPKIPTEEPDVVIFADIHPWEDYYTIDGGIITPDK